MLSPERLPSSLPWGPGGRRPDQFIIISVPGDDLVLVTPISLIVITGIPFFNKISINFTIAVAADLKYKHGKANQTEYKNRLPAIYTDGYHPLILYDPKASFAI